MEKRTLNSLNSIIKSIDGGASTVGRSCGVSAAAVRRWKRQGRLPRTEHTRETQYADKIAELAKAAGVDITPDLLRGFGYTKEP